ELYTINGSQLKEIVEKDPMLYKDLMGVAGKRLHSTLHGLENISMKNSYRRVAHELCYLAAKFGEETVSEGTRIGVPLTHQDLASILSMSRETVSISMSRLQKNGLIDSSRNVIIYDLEKLKTEAYDKSN